MLAANIELMEKFIEANKSGYKGKYRHRASYKNGDYSIKCHYYMLDNNFKRIDIFVDVFYKDEIKYSFSEDLHQEEKIYIVKDILNCLKWKASYMGMLHYSLYDSFIENKESHNIPLNPIDYCNILDYMKYHKDINQATIDEFYSILFPHLENLINTSNYKKFMDSVILLLKTVLYEHEWDGINSKYLDTEYQYHLYYIRNIIKLVCKHLDKFYKDTLEELKDAIEVLCSNQRFSLMIMTDFGNLVLSQVSVAEDLMEHLSQYFVLNEKDVEKENVNLVFSYIYYTYKSDYEQYRAVVIKIIRMIINNMLTFANSDLDLALGNAILRDEGFELLLELFQSDYNTFIFTCFPINTFPDELIPTVRRELERAVQFFAARMQNDKYRLSSFEQVYNINKLLLNNFGGWYK